MTRHNIELSMVCNYSAIDLPHLIILAIIVISDIRINQNEMPKAKTIL